MKNAGRRKTIFWSEQEETESLGMRHPTETGVYDLSPIGEGLGKRQGFLVFVRLQISIVYVSQYPGSGALEPAHCCMVNTVVYAQPTTPNIHNV